MTRADPAVPVFGRAQLVGLTVRVATGAAGAPQGVLLVGEPGIGKSMLLRHAMAQVPNPARVLFASGTEPHHIPPFTALADLIRPIADRIADLPITLRDALHDVMGTGGDSVTPAPAGIQQAVLALTGQPTTPDIQTESLVVTADNMADPEVAKYIYKSAC